MSFTWLSISGDYFIVKLVFFYCQVKAHNILHFNIIGYLFLKLKIKHLTVPKILPHLLTVE
jgi:hypothetical protein